MYKRRDVLKSSAIGTTMGIGVLASSSTTTATGASFGDGVNLQPAYYCSGEQDLGWDLMNEYPDIETVRIEIEPPTGGETSATLSDIRRWIDEANANGYQVIATYHHWPSNGSGDPQDLQDAANWWVENYDYLSQNSSFTINLHNEWGTHEVSVSEYGSAYDSALSKLRDSNYDGTVICDVPGYGQEPQIAADSVGYIGDDNIAFSVHVYAKAWNEYAGEPLKESHLDYLNSNQPYPCLVGEFGPLGPDDRTDWSAVVDHAKELGWPVLGWAWNGDGESDPMNMISPFWGDDCSATSYSKTSYFDTVYNKLSGGGSGDGGGETTTQYLNAEYYSLDGVSTATSRTDYWGDAYVTGFDSSGDSVTVNFDAVTSGERTVKIRYAAPYDDKECNLYINSQSVGQALLPYSTSFQQTDAGTYQFVEGYNEITIEKGWGYYDIDAIIVK